MNKARLQNQVRTRRKNRTRAKIKGTKARPRLAVFRSNKGMYVQLINDENHETMASCSSRELDAKGPKIDIAKKIGKTIAERAEKIGIKTVVFDRSSYRYHGRVKALAESAREAGLTF